MSTELIHLLSYCTCLQPQIAKTPNHRGIDPGESICRNDAQLTSFGSAANGKKKAESYWLVNLSPFPNISPPPTPEIMTGQPTPP